MHSSPSTPAETAPDLARLSLAEALGMVLSLTETVAHLQRQLDWFKRQLFGTKSERFIDLNPLQMNLGEALPLPPVSPPVRVK